MADVSRVEYNDEPLIDLTNDTVTPMSLRSGFTAHNAAGDPIVGVGGLISNDDVIVLKDSNNVPWYIRVTVGGELVVSSS